MVQAQKVPEERLRPDKWTGPYDPLRNSELIEWLTDRQESFIGSSYYFIRSDKKECTICRMTITGGCLYAINSINHGEHGITEDDLSLAVRHAKHEPEIPGHYHIDIHIERKLRTLLEV